MKEKKPSPRTVFLPPVWRAFLWPQRLSVYKPKCIQAALDPWCSNSPTALLSKTVKLYVVSVKIGWLSFSSSTLMMRVSGYSGVYPSGVVANAVSWEESKIRKK